MPWRYHWLMFASLSLGMASCGQERVSPTPANEDVAVSPAPSPPVMPPEMDSDQAAVASSATDGATKAEDPDAAYREAIVGVWKQKNTGIRWLRIRSDGTATMYIDPDWIAKAIIGDALTMQIEWSIEDGRAVMNSVSGTPQSAFEAVTTLFGSKRDRPIVELNDEQFVLRDEEDGSLSKWARVDPETTMPKAIAEG